MDTTSPDQTRPRTPKAERLATALRANLQRRKAQSRARSRTRAAEAGPEAPPDADADPGNQTRRPLPPDRDG